MRNGVWYVTSRETTGIVRKVDTTNSTCGGKHKYDCTMFNLTIDLIDFPQSHNRYLTYFSYNTSSVE
jgi:hypothetical protein